MAFKKLIAQCLLVSAIGTSCISAHEVADYTTQPSTLNYLMETPEALPKTGKSIFVEVTSWGSPEGKVELLDSKMLFLLFYNSVKTDELYSLDRDGFRENLKNWMKAAFERELERNSKFTAAGKKEEADYIMLLEIENAKATSRLLSKGEDVNIPLGVSYGAATISNQQFTITEGSGKVKLKYTLINMEREVILSDKVNRGDQLSPQAGVGVPILLETRLSSSNAQAVERLSLSFQSGFEAILEDLNSINPEFKRLPLSGL